MSRPILFVCVSVALAAFGCEQKEAPAESSTSASGMTTVGSQDPVDVPSNQSRGETATSEVVSHLGEPGHLSSEATESAESTIRPRTDSRATAASNDNQSSSSAVTETVDGAASAVTSNTSPVEDPTSTSSQRLTAKPVGTTDAALGYWEYLPENYGAEPLPLLVFTHGAGWMGDGSQSTLETTLKDKDWPLVSLIRDDRWPNQRPFVVLAPQNPHSGCFRAEDIDAFYRYAVDAYSVDRKRIYHTGQSCGAVGTLNYLGEHLDEFVTAAVLVSTAGANEGFSKGGCDLGKVSIWALHNEFDEVTGDTASPSIDLIANLLACSPAPDAKLTIYPGESAHDAWTKTYDLSAGNDVFGWLLQHSHP